MPRVVFTPSGLDAVVDSGTTVLDAARRLGVDLDSVCGGRQVCGRCQVVVGKGQFSKWGIEVGDDAIAVEPSSKRTARPVQDGKVLGCLAHIERDVVVDVPAESQVHRQVIRKDVALDGVVIDPLFELFYIELDEMTLGHETTAARQVTDALLAQHGVEARCASSLLAHLHVAIAGRSATAARRVHDGRVVALWPGFVDAAYGIAIDIGSTTVAGHLMDLQSGTVLASAGTMNPQIRFGEDLMSRVSYVMMNPGGDRELTTSIRTALNDLVGQLVGDAAVDAQQVLDVTLVGNPVMHHIVLGIDPTPLGMAPFILATDESVNIGASELDLSLPFASVYVAPCIAGHVGADTAAAMLAEAPYRSEVMQLLVDVGTNAEIVLGDARRQFAASSPTGPAFEGAQISCGQRATAGAIERVRIDRSTLEPRFKVIGSDLWSDDAGFADATKDLNISGICGSGIIEVIAEMYLSGIVSHDGVVDGTLAERTPRIVADDRTYTYVLQSATAKQPAPITVTQNDVRAIQLAKAALRAGIDLLMEHAGCESIHDVRLAGAFGAHIDPLYAMVLGLVPDAPLEGVRSVGNAAGSGAARALLSAALRREMEAAVRQVEKIETATEPRFQELFVQAMAFPHAVAPTPNLAALVALPERKTATAGERRRRREGGRSRSTESADQAATTAPNEGLDQGDVEAQNPVPQEVTS